MLYLCTRKQENTDYHNDSVAQLVEHNTFNVGVLGSSPSQVTNTLAYVEKLVDSPS